MCAQVEPKTLRFAQGDKKMLFLILILFILGYTGAAMWATAGGQIRRLWLLLAASEVLVLAVGLFLASYKFGYRIDKTLQSGRHLFDSLLLAIGALGVPALISTLALLFCERLAPPLRFGIGVIAGLAGALAGSLMVIFLIYH